MTDINIEETQEITCPLCAKCQQGTRKCATYGCSNFIHHIDECSEPFEGTEEGYSQLRRCKKCVMKKRSESASSTSKIMKTDLKSTNKGTKQNL